MQHRSTITLIVIALGSASCADDAAVVETTGRTLETIKVEGPTRAIETPTWPKTKPSQEAIGGLSEASKQAIQRSPTPVLIPSGQTSVGPVTVMAEEHWFAASSRGDGLTVSISATDVVHHQRGVEPATGKDTLRQSLGFVTQNEGIWSATWRENGASYAATVECESKDDGRCASSAFIQALVSDLVYVGGKGAEVLR